MLANFFNLKFNLKMELDLNNMFFIMPNDWLSESKGVGAYAFTDDFRFPLIVFSHNRYDASVHEGKKNVLLLRNVFDVMVSEYFHSTKFIEKYSKDIECFIKSEKGGLKRYVDYLNSWTPFYESGDIKIITYENMVGNPFKVSACLLEFMGIQVEKDLLNQAIACSSFENMKKLEKEKGFPGAKGEYSDIESRRMRKGKVGGYKDYLDADLIHYIRDYCNEKLLPGVRNKYMQKIIR